MRAERSPAGSNISGTSPWCSSWRFSCFRSFWWALASIKPILGDLQSRTGPVYLDFKPTPDNYRVTLLGKFPGWRLAPRVRVGDAAGVIKGGANSYDSSPVDPGSTAPMIAVGSTALVRGSSAMLGGLCAVAASTFPGRQSFLFWILSQRFMPPIAVVIPIVFMFRDYAGLRDSYLGLILVHTLINLPHGRAVAEVLLRRCAEGRSTRLP